MSVVACLLGRERPSARWWAVLGLCLAAAPARAATVQVSSTTLLWARPEWRGGASIEGAPLVQWVRLSAQEGNLPVAEQLLLQVSAWGRALSYPSNTEAAADVDVAYLQGQLLQSRLQVTLGRQVISGGVARFTHLDGVNVEGRLTRSVGLSAYGGLQVIPRFTAGRGDAVTGARLYYRPSFESEVGASVIQVLDKGLIARRDMGVDGRWALSSRLVFNASALFSLVEARLAEGELAAQWQVLPALMLVADVRRVAPDLYLPRSSIFSVFSSEQQEQAGGSAAWQPLPGVKVYGEYHLLRTAEGVGHDAGTRATMRLGRGSTVGAQARLLHTSTNGYLQGRLWARHTLLPQLVLSADVEGTSLEAPINGERHSLTASATASWGFAPGWSAQLSGVGGTTPLFASRYEVIARLAYDLPPLGGAKP